MSLQKPQELSVEQALNTFQEAREAYQNSREQLTAALGAMVGRRIDITGFPDSKVIASSVDEEGNVLKRTRIPSYRIRLNDEAYESRQVKAITDHTVIAMKPDGLHIAPSDSENPKKQFDVLGYIFMIDGIKSLRLIENIDK